jgi:hypothetical protein
VPTLFSVSIGTTSIRSGGRGSGVGGFKGPATNQGAWLAHRAVADFHLTSTEVVLVSRVRYLPASKARRRRWADALSAASNRCCGVPPLS